MIMRGFKDALERDIALERQMLKWIKKEIKRLPEGRLKQGNNGKAVYVNRIQSLPPEGKRAWAIAWRNLLEAKQRTIEENLKWQEIITEKYKSYRDDRVLERMRPVYQRIIEAGWEKAAKKKQDAKITAQQEALASGTAYHAEHLIHKNFKGEINRSKSEIIIDNIYQVLRIPYSYEERVYWPENAPPEAWEMKRRLGIPDFYVPDYTCTLPDGTKKYHEHLGRMSKEDYMENWMKKMILYYWAGIIPGKNLIITADDCRGGIDQQAIMDLLQHELRELVGLAR
jgi:hypothetical protein